MHQAEAKQYDYDDAPSKDDEQKLREIEELIQIFGSGLQVLVDQQVGLKEELERRWLDDLRHYNGKPDAETEGKIKQEGKSNGSRIFVNLTRAKTNSAESKWSDLILPTDDRNWGIKPTPVPELADAMESDEPVTLADGSVAVDEETNEPYTEKDLAIEVQKEAVKRAESMQSEIDDQLTEARFNAVCREVIHDATVMGTGILKGPMVERRAKRAWIEGEDGVWQLNQIEEFKPSAARVDPWNFFPDMSATDWDSCEFVFERHLLTRKQMRRLLKQPGFMVDKVRDVLRMAPNARRSDISYLNHLREINGITQIQNDNRYEVWEYHGPVKKEHMMACGCKGIDPDDPLDEYEGVVWFSQGIVLKVALNHMDSSELPYSILNWEADETSVFGFGVPYRMRHPQRVMNASWRMVLDNAGLSTGPQIVINRKIIEPANGKWELEPRKVWYLTDERAKVEDAFDTFDIQSHQQELTAIFEMAHRLADEETSLPQMQMGNQPGDTQQPAMLKTLGGTALWMSANNIMMRRAVKNFDDNITVPFITRMYDWNMQFNPKNEIKGDYQVDARGTSVLLVREIQARNMMEFIQAAMSIPGGMERLKEDGVLKQLAKALQVPENELIKTDQEMQADKPKEGEQQQPDPEIMKIEMQREIAQIGLQEKQIESEAMLNARMIDREVELTKLASEQELNIAEMQKKYGLEKYKVDWDAKKFYDEIGIKQRMGETANYGLDG